MESESVKIFILSQSEIQAPSVQKQFSLSYTEMKVVLEELEKEDAVEFVSGVTYKVNKEANKHLKHSAYQPQDEQEATYIKVLWECIQSDNVSISFIQRKLSVDYNHAGKAIEWMEENGYISAFPERKVIMSQGEFIKKFGNPNKETDLGEDEFQRYLDERRRALMERLQAMDDDEDEEEDSVEGEDEFEARMSRKLRMMHGEDDDDNDDFDDTSDEFDESDDLKSVIIKSIAIGLQEISEQNIFILGLEGGLQFELKYVQEGEALRISDGGNTLLQVDQSKQKVKSILKNFAPVALDGDEIFIKIENPLGTLMALLTLYSAIDAIKKLK